MAARGERLVTRGMARRGGIRRRLPAQRRVRHALLVNGHRAPLIGRVSMDMITVDVTDLPGVARPTGGAVGDGVPVERSRGTRRDDSYELICGVSQPCTRDEVSRRSGPQPSA